MEIDRTPLPTFPNQYWSFALRELPDGGLRFGMTLLYKLMLLSELVFVVAILLISVSQLQAVGVAEVLFVAVAGWIWLCIFAQFWGFNFIFSPSAGTLTCYRIGRGCTVPIAEVLYVQLLPGGWSVRNRFGSYDTYQINLGLASGRVNVVHHWSRAEAVRDVAIIARAMKIPIDDALPAELSEKT